MELLIKFLAIVETCALVFGLFYATKGIKTKHDEASRKGHYYRAGIFIAIYLALNILRRFLF